MGSELKDSRNSGRQFDPPKWTSHCCMLHMLVPMCEAEVCGKWKQSIKTKYSSGNIKLSRNLHLPKLLLGDNNNSREEEERRQQASNEDLPRRRRCQLSFLSFLPLRSPPRSPPLPRSQATPHDNFSFFPAASLGHAQILCLNHPPSDRALL